MDKARFKVTVIGIIFDPEKRLILIGKNKGDKNFSFLEGGLTHDQELDIRLKEVTAEKTGYKIHNLGAVYVDNCLDKKSDNKCKEKVEMYFLCEATEGEEKPGEDVEELKWIKPSEVESILGIKLPSRLKEYIMNLK